MVRIAGVDLPNKHVPFALAYIYGVGVPLAKKIAAELRIDVRKKIEQLSPEEVRGLQQRVEKELKVENDLRREIRENIKRMVTISAYRGVRHARKLPVRGQRTRTNARTLRGKRKTATSGKRKLTKT